MANTEFQRKCVKCHTTADNDKTANLRFHRFPLPGKHGSLRTRVWAEYCFPDENWSTEESLRNLSKQHKLLCSKHFNESSYTSSSRTRLNKFAIPVGTESIMWRLRQEEFSTSSEPYTLHHLNRIGNKVIDTCPPPSITRPPPSITRLPPADTRLPPSDTHLRPSDTRLPPADTRLPPSDTHLRPSDTRLPPADTRLPPSDTHLRPSDTRLPPADTRLPSSDTHLRPSITRLPPSDTRLPPSDTHLRPSDTRLPPSDTHLRPSITRLPPSDTHLRPSDTRLPPADTRPPPLDTEDTIDNYYNLLKWNSSEDDDTDEPALLGLSQIAKTYKRNQPVEKPVVAVQSANCEAVVDESAVTLNTSTSPGSELSVESTDRKLDGFKLGVSEKVLQFQLVDDGDCDEPIYKVLTEEKPEIKEDKTCSTEDDTVLQEDPSTTHEDNVENESESKENVPKYVNRKDMEYWKLKLTQILHETNFCGICLNAEDGMNAISDEFEIVNCEVMYRNTLRHIVDSVFKETDYPLANTKVCKSCTKKLIQSYIFIRSAEETAKVLNHHLDELYYKTCYIRNNDLKQKQAGSEIYNVVIALDKDIPKSFDCDIKIEEPETAESELIRPRAKRKLKCVSCNVILPSYRAWRVHETRTHKSNHRCRICLQSFKTRQDITAHYRMHLNSRCTICHRRVQDGRLLQHLKRRHGRSIHLCSTCDVAFYSATALDRHDRECHYSADSRCVTCLRSLSRDELELHRCRFACPECGEAPCVHHEYLMSYREQVLNLADRAACQHCSYVCASKEALVAHANARHLKVQPLRCGRCALTFHSRSDLRSHVCTSKQTSKYVHACQYCDKQFSEEVMCGRHSKECGRVQRQHQCEYCPANFDSSKNLIEHRKRKHGKGMFPCNLCDRVFLNDIKKNKHLLQVHSRHKERDSSSDCVVCRKRFPTKAALILHLRYHEPGTKFPCGVCRAQFDTVAHFSAHNCKRTRLWTICDTCGAVVKQVLLRKHMRAHSGAAVTCDTCGKSFQNVTTLQYHLKRHQRNVSCRICKKLMNSAKLWRHFRNHIIRDSIQEKFMIKEYS